MYVAFLWKCTKFPCHIFVALQFLFTVSHKQIQVLCSCIFYVSVCEAVRQLFIDFKKAS